MNLIKNNWDKNDYSEFIQFLYSIQDIKYKSFHSKLILSNNLVGIKTDILKNISKDISNGDYESFIKLDTHKLYEEKIIHGLIIGFTNDQYDKKIKMFNNYVKYIDSWAICDIVCSNMKIFKKYQDLGIIEIEKYLNNINPWINRVGIVLLLNYYINDNYIDYIINRVKLIKSDNYYVNMALSWLISICYIKYKDKTKLLFKHGILDDFVYNKSIQKIIESRRIDINEKNVLRSMKI